MRAYVVASACMGIAAGLIAYRFGMQPLGWTSSLKHAFVGFSAAMLVVGIQQLKGATERPALPIVAGVGLAGAGLAFLVGYVIAPPLGHARLATHALPGFSIDLPDGEVHTEAYEYAVGKLTLKDIAGTGGVVGVEWEAGKSSREDLELAAKALSPKVGATGAPTMASIDGPGGAQVDMFVLDNDKAPLRMTFVDCGARRILIVTMGGTGADSLHRRIVPTLACTPDPKLEPTSDGAVPFVADLPGYVAVERLPGQLMLSDGAAMVMVKHIAGPSTSLDELLEPMFAAAGWPVKVTGKTGDRIQISGTIDGEMVHGWARQLSCRSSGLVVLGIAETAEVAEQVATRTASARCTKPGETPTQWPDPPPDEPAPADAPVKSE